LPKYLDCGSIDTAFDSLEGLYYNTIPSILKSLSFFFEKKLFFSEFFIVLVQFPIWDYLSCILGEK